MSYIPDARSLFTRTAYTERDEPTPFNAYWQGLLDENGKNTLMGYDDAVRAVNCLFDNLNVYTDAIEAVFGEGFLDEVDVHKVNGISPFSGDLMSESSGDVDKDYHQIDEYSEKEFKKMTQATKVCLLLKYILNDWMEMERDEVNASLIENMDDKEHEENEKKAVERYGETLEEHLSLRK